MRAAISLPPVGLGAMVPDAIDRRNIACAGTAVLAFIALVAGVVAVAFAAGARDALQFGFAGVPRTAAEASSILLNNSRLLVVPFAGALVLHASRASAQDAGAAGGLRVTRTVCDVLIGGLVALNAAVVGLALGAYGDRMVVAMLPHGPVELVAFSCSIALYLRARRYDLRAPVVARLVGLSLGLLAVAAFLETYLHLL